MIRSRAIINTEPLSDFADFANSFDQVVGILAEESYEAVRDPFLDELEYYPPELPNQQYVRTFTLRDSYSLEFIKGGGEYQVVARSSAPPQYRYVRGTFDRRRNRTVQARIHRGRWPLVADIVDFWQDAFFDEFGNRFDRYIDDSLGQFEVGVRNR